MNKKFFEVFPTLKVKDDMRLLLQDVEVSKVTTNSNRDFVRIHIESAHLLQKKMIYRVESMVKEQLFGKNRLQIEVKEQYHLSAQYTPENLLNEYLDSILEELGTESVVERSMMQSATWSFETENVLILQLTDTIVAKGKKEHLVHYLERIFAERFCCPIEVHVT